MKLNPILPIWLMAALCIIMLFVKKKGFFAYFRQFLIVLLVFLINLRIMIPGGEIESSSYQKDLSVLFVVDNTISMTAKDYKKGEERLTGVKKDCADIIDTLYGADFSVLTFDNTAKVISPFTSDTDFAKNTIDSIAPMNSLYAKGSSLNTCKELLLETLKELKEKEENPVAVFFISDGEITNEDTLESFQKAAEYIDYGAVLGYGTKKGGKMYETSFDGEETTIIQDKTEFPYKDALSKIDEGNLKQLAKDMDLNYINMNQAEELSSVLNNIQKKTAMIAGESGTSKGYQDIYGWFLIPLLLLLVFEYKSCKYFKKGKLERL